MADVHTKEVRSFNMSKIRSKNTKPEMLVREYLFASGFRYRLHQKNLPGKPDIVLKKYNTVILVDGCFWHGHTGCKYFVVPKTRTEWWLNKITRNQELDKQNVCKLKEQGWNVIVLFECMLKKKTFELTIRKVLTNLSKQIK